MTIYDMIWYDMIWYDIIWYDMIWCGIWVIWNGMMLYTLLGKSRNWLSYPLSYHFCTQCCVASGVLGLCVCLALVVWVGVGCLRRCMVTLGPLIFSSATTGGCLNNPISYSGKYAACWAYFMRHHGLRPTAVSHPFCSLHISLCLAGVNHYQRITILRIVFQKLVLPGAFFVFFLLSFPLTFVWLVCYFSLRLYFNPGNYS